MENKDAKAYQEGYKASQETDSQPELAQNPYPIHSDSWESWNQGWNAHFEPAWLSPKS